MFRFYLGGLCRENTCSTIGTQQIKLNNYSLDNFTGGSDVRKRLFWNNCFIANGTKMAIFFLGNFKNGIAQTSDYMARDKEIKLLTFITANKKRGNYNF